MTTQTEDKAISKPDLMKEIGIDMDEISRRMAFVDLTEEDIALLSDMGDFAKGYADQAVASFYQHLLSFRETRLLLKDQGMIDRLISSQKIYLMDIFRGRFDQAYFERRLRTGAIHYKIGLKPKWYMEIYAFYENKLTTLISEAYGHEPDRGLKRDQALRKIFRLDMVLALEYYFHSYYLEMTAKLNSNLRSMDDFTRMLSHDLKEPLRGIEAFSSFLLEDYASMLDPEGQRYLNFLKESATRMKELIHDLLTLVSIKQKGPNLDAVDLNPVLSQVITDLKFSIEQKKATVNVLAPLPTIHCDAIQVGEVFRNLISNAIKFNTAEKPLIEIGAKESKSTHSFSVKDNGIGIDPAYQEQILDAFERLHPQDEFEGTGVGLAICKRIVENYGGKLWLESEPQVGSTFYFSLPKTSQF